jgi:hypothetical protein
MLRIVSLFCLTGLAWALLGCGAPGEKLVAVSGRVTVAGKSWTRGQVGFFPHAARGNQRGVSSVAEIGPDGSYTLLTSGKAGAPPGWYKVVVWATDDPAAAGNPWGPDGKRRPIQWLIDPVYTSPETTPLELEVVERPASGQYDLRLDR